MIARFATSQARHGAGRMTGPALNTTTRQDALPPGLNPASALARVMGALVHPRDTSQHQRGADGHGDMVACADSLASPAINNTAADSALHASHKPAPRRRCNRASPQPDRPARGAGDCLAGYRRTRMGAWMGAYPPFFFLRQTPRRYKNF
jgi:hypothetical protein